MYILVCLYLICVFCRVKNTLSPPQHNTIHPKDMEVVTNVIETCDKEAEQKLLLKGSYVHMDIVMNHLVEKTQGEMLKVQNNCLRNTVLML